MVYVTLEAFEASYVADARSVDLISEPQNLDLGTETRVYALLLAKLWGCTQLASSSYKAISPDSNLGRLIPTLIFSFLLSSCSFVFILWNSVDLDLDYFDPATVQAI